MKIEQSLLERFFNPFEQISDAERTTVETYRDHCITEILHNQGEQYPDLHYASVFDKLSSKTVTQLQESFEGARVIEIGPGAHPQAERLFKEYNIQEYVGLEPFHPKLTLEALPAHLNDALVEQQDGLSYLLQQPSKSAVVISFGVFCPENFTQTNLAINYFRFLGRETYRVCPQNTLTPHQCNPPTSRSDLFFSENGFLPGDGIGDRHTTLWKKN